MESMDFGSLTSGVEETGRLNNNNNDGGNNNNGSSTDYLSSGHHLLGSNSIIKKELENPYTPQHDSGHSSIESIEHQSSSSSSHSQSSTVSTSCRNCGRIEYATDLQPSSQQQQQQQFETIKLDELFTHVSPSPSPSTISIASPAGTNSTSLRKSILQNGLCSTCVHGKSSKHKLTDSCSNSPSQTSSIESPSSGVLGSMNSTVILKAEPSSQTYMKQESYESHEARVDRIMSMLPMSNSAPTIQNTPVIPNVIVNPSTLINRGDAKMEVEVEGSGRCTIEVIPIPQELQEMLKNMPHASIPTVVTNSNYGSFQILDPSQFQHPQQHIGGEIINDTNITYQHVQEEVIIGDVGQQEHVFLNSNSSINSTSSFPKSSTKTKGVVRQKRPRGPTVIDPNKTYSTTRSITETIDDVLRDCREYAANPTNYLDNGETAQDLSRSVMKIEVSEQMYTLPPKFMAPAPIPTPIPAKIKNKGFKNISTSTAKSRNKNPKISHVKGKPLGQPPIINLAPFSSSSKPTSSRVYAKKSTPPIIHLPPLPVCSPTNTETPTSSMYITNSTNSADKTVGCAACNKTFKNKRLCKAHYQRVHDKLQKYTCSICGLKFIYRGSLDSHLTTHKLNLHKHTCKVCGKTFKERSNLSQHLRLHQQGHRQFKCEFCPSSFSKRVNARYHMKRKHPDLYPTSSMFLSTYGANNSSNSQQQQNMVPNTSGMDPSGMMYGSQNPSTTTTAPLPTYNPQDYSYMINQPVPGGSQSTETGDKKGEGEFKCEYCGRGFLFKNNLKAHLRTHTRDKKYTCNLCDKGFIYKESLKNHMLLHSNSFPYTCEICHKSFRDRSNRRKHVKNVHKHLLVNGEIPSAYQGTNPDSVGGSSSGDAAPPPKKKPARTRKPKKSQVPSTTTDEYGNINEFAASSSTATSINNASTTKTGKKSGKTQGKKNLSNPRNTNNNQSVIVSTNASSSTDLNRGIIMSSGGVQTKSPMEYSYISTSNLPVTVHIPSITIPVNQSQQQQQLQQRAFGRNVIVKAPSPDSQQHQVVSRLSTDQNIYLSTGGGTPMQQNVIVYPKPKTSLLESYSSEVNQSVIAPNIQQYYTQGTASYDANTNSAPYAHLIPSSRLSPGTSNPPTPPTFVETNYLPSTNRGRSNSLTGSSTISSNEAEAIGILQRGNVHYTTSISAPPIYSSDGSSSTGAHNNHNSAQQQYQFWSQIPASSSATPNNGTANDTQQQTFYNQTIIATTSSPSAQLLEGQTHISTAPNVITVPSYNSSEVLVAADQASTNTYYKDFDFSYFMNPPNAQ